jgi:hypothetical protein
MRAFLSNHPTLIRLIFRGQLALEDRDPREPPAPTALPHIEHLLANAAFAAWVLQSVHAFPSLTIVTLELDKSILPADYTTCLRGIARRPTVRTLCLQLYEWHPWVALQNTAVENDVHSPRIEQDVTHIADLRLTFRRLLLPRREIPVLPPWLRLFAGVREVSMFGMSLEPVCEILRAECPGIRFVAHTTISTSSSSTK